MRGSYNLLVSTLTFGWCFSIWTLYAFAGLGWQSQWHLSATELSILLASPIFSGALMRLPAGFLIDRFCPKRIWQLALLMQTPPLWLLASAQSYVDHLMLGLWLGVAGVSFTVGSKIAIQNVHPNNAAISLGIFGIGNAGAIISLLLISYHTTLGLTMPLLYKSLAVLNLLVLLFFSMFSTKNSTSPSTQRIALKGHVEPAEKNNPINLWTEPRIWRFSLYYYFVFGCFLALMLWLPHYYMSAYQLDSGSALAFTLFFVTTSSLVRGLGGWLSARYGGRNVSWSVFWICLVCLFFLSYPPTELTISGIEHQVNLRIEVGIWLFTALIFVIGIAQGLGRASVYSLLYQYYPKQFGQASGLVSAAGAVGGFTLPVLFGISQDLVGIYSACFMVLYGVLACCMMLMFLANRKEQFQRELAKARADNFLMED